MADQMITLRNKKTGEIITVPRSQFKAAPTKEKGFRGIAEDVSQSLSSLPEAAGEMISSIPGGAANVAKYFGEKPGVETLANLGAGAVEAGSGALSAPQILARYLGDKFPSVKKLQESGTTPGMGSVNDPTIYEALQKFEKEHGLAPQSEEEGSVRNLGGLLTGGKALTMLPNLLSRALALASESAGRGGDPVHAAILSAIGETALKGTGKGINKAADINKPIDIYNQPSLTANMGAVPSGSPYMQTISNLPKAALNIGKSIPRAIAKTPEVAAQTLASALESGADAITSRVDIPGVQPILGGVASYLKHLSVPPEEMAKRTLFGDIEKEDIPKMIERDEAGKRLGLTYLTPSELMDSPFESVKQGDIGRTTKGMKLLYKLGEEREASEGRAINKLMDRIYNEKLAPEKKAAYEKTMQNEVPEDFIQEQLKRPVIQRAIKKVEKNPAFRQKIQEELGLPVGDAKPTNFMYWDMVKRALGDLEKKAEENGQPTEESSIIGDTRRSMVEKMDAIEPAYKQARRIAERGFTRRKLKKFFNKRDKSFNKFHEYLKDEEKFEDLQDKLQDLPEALQQLQDIKLFSGKMIPNNPTVRAAAALKRTGMSDARNPLEAKKRALDEKYGQEHDVAAVKLMTNPNFMKEFAAHLLKGGK